MGGTYVGGNTNSSTSSLQRRNAIKKKRHDAAAIVLCSSSDLINRVKSYGILQSQKDTISDPAYGQKRTGYNYNHELPEEQSCSSSDNSSTDTVLRNRRPVSQTTCSEGNALRNILNTTSATGRNIKHVPAFSFEDSVELDSVADALSEITIPPTSSSRRISSYSFTSELSNRSTSSHGTMIQSCKYSGAWVPTTLPIYNSEETISKVAGRPQPVIIPRKRDKQKLCRKSRFREEFGKPELGPSSQVFYDGNDDSGSERPSPEFRPQTRRQTRASYRQNDEPRQLMPSIGYYNQPQSDFGPWSTAFNLYNEERRCPTAQVADYSGWGAVRRNTLYPLAKSNTSRSKFEPGRPSVSPSVNSEEYEHDQTLASRVPSGQFLQIPRTRQPWQNDKPNRSQHSLRSYTDRLRTTPEILEDDEEVVPGQTQLP